MGLIPEHIIGEIRDRADIVAIVGQHVKLRKAGTNHKGLCPFHQEKSPSFSVNADKGFFYCFGCQKKGDIFTFMMELEGKSFVEAAESLAERLGIIIPTEAGKASAQGRSRRGELLKATSLARGFFIKVIGSEQGKAARDYLESRAITDETAAAFGLGCAPDAWGELGDFLAKNGVGAREAEAAGLLIPRKSGSGTYDRFRNRLMCPVATASGDCVGFSGRRLSNDGGENDKGAKYINSPESPIYKKSRLLFGLDRARDGFRARKRAVLVEGNFDVVSLHQAGFTETVAPLGTALTDDQAVRLKRLVDRVVLLFDGDNAGRAATLKSLKVLLHADLDVRIANLPQGVDPDDLVRSNGPEALGSLLEKAQDGVLFFIDNLWTTSESPDERAKAIPEAADVLMSVPGEAKRGFYIDQLSKSIQINVTDLRRHLRNAVLAARGKAQPIEITSQEVENVADPPHDELDILAILVDHPALVEKAKTLNVFSLLTDARVRDMYSAAVAGQPMVSDAHNLSPNMAKAVLGGKYASLESPTETLQTMVATISRKLREMRLPELQREAQLARRRGDAERARTLVSEILTIRKQVD